MLTTTGIPWKILLASLLVLGLMLAGCKSTTTQPLTAQEVADKFIAGSSTLDKYAFDMDVTVVMEVPIPGEVKPQPFKVTATGKGEVDAPKKAAKLVVQTKAEALTPLSQAFEQKVETYVRDGMVYVGTADISGKAQWTKMKVNDPEQNQLSAPTVDEVAKLMKGTPVENLGTEEVDGKKAHVLKVSPDMVKLLELVMKDSLFEANLEEADSIVDMVKSLSVKVWISEEGFKLLKQEVQMTMAFDSSSLGIPGFASMTYDLHSITSFSYDAKVSIVVPQEALNAPETPLTK